MCFGVLKVRREGVLRSVSRSRRRGALREKEGKRNLDPGPEVSVSLSLRCRFSVCLVFFN